MKRRVIKSICFIAIFAILFSGLTCFFKVADGVSLINIKGIQKEKANSLDVALIGASEVYSGYAPTVAWKEYGYTSYTMGVSGVPGSLYKSMLKEVLKKQNPQLVVIEINGLVRGDEYFNRTGKMHIWLDNLPWGNNRVDTIEELVEKESRMDFINMISTYHDNWKNLGKCMQTTETRLAMHAKSSNDLKGFATITKIAGKDDYGIDKGFTFTNLGESYLKDLIQYCKDEKLENVLFVRFPHGKEITNQKALDRFQSVVEASGYDFLNLNSAYDEVGIVLREDFYNADHLNVYGMEKMTKYLGAYITDKYAITPNTDADVLEAWKESAEVTDEVIKRMKQETDKSSGKRYNELSAYLVRDKSGILANVAELR